MDARLKINLSPCGNVIAEQAESERVVSTCKNLTLTHFPYSTHIRDDSEDRINFRPERKVRHSTTCIHILPIYIIKLVNVLLRPSNPIRRRTQSSSRPKFWALQKQSAYDMTHVAEMDPTTLACLILHYVKVMFGWSAPTSGSYIRSKPMFWQMSPNNDQYVNIISVPRWH